MVTAYLGLPDKAILEASSAAFDDGIALTACMMLYTKNKGIKRRILPVTRRRFECHDCQLDVVGVVGGRTTSPK